jgi:hypothetical protein
MLLDSRLILGVPERCSLEWSDGDGLDRSVSVGVDVAGEVLLEGASYCARSLSNSCCSSSLLLESASGFLDGIYTNVCRLRRLYELDTTQSRCIFRHREQAL